MSVHFVTYKEIDKKKWDNCIQKAENGLIYGKAFYLDAMSENWDALILDDYSAVMPLTWKAKWGIQYLYQPAFIQQSGIFFTKALSDDQVVAFLEAAMQKFKFAEITMNYLNKIPDDNGRLQVQQRNNFIIDLYANYESLYNNYDDSFTKSLRRIRKFNLVYQESTDYEKGITLYKELYSKRLPHFSANSFTQLALICKMMQQENNLVVRQAIDRENKLLAMVVLLKYKNRLYNIISCITKDGKQVEANYFLYDRIINEFSNMPVILDLEGSDVAGIATFYKKFNPQNQPYPFIKYNELPGIIKLFKS